MPKADPFAQHRLLDVAAVDKALDGARHRRATLPALAAIEAARRRLESLRAEEVLAETEVSDLARAERKLTQEIDQVRTRSDRDAARLASGAAAAKELENLQHEITSLARRQGVLEDEALELMERQENAGETLAAVRSAQADERAALTGAETTRDEVFAEVDAETTRLDASRSELVTGMPADLLALYDRIHAQGKVAAARLIGDRCEACRIGLDRVEVTEIRASAVTEIKRCPECGAILIRS